MGTAADVRQWTIIQNAGIFDNKSDYTHHSGQTDFAWQNGYGAFSVSASKIRKVQQYILNQEKHHEKLSFQDEYRAFLKKHGVQWDERYVWD